jgi:hypothetical protein
MTRKLGDHNFANYIGFQAFSSSEPTHRINNSNWYLKTENGLPGFFLKSDAAFRQMPPKCFYDTATKSRTAGLNGWQQQCEKYFNKPMKEIEKLWLKEESIKPKSSSSSINNLEKIFAITEPT